MNDNRPEQENKNSSLDFNADKYEIEYVKERTGASKEDILQAMKTVGKNWVNIIYYIRSKRKNKK